MLFNPYSLHYVNFGLLLQFRYRNRPCLIGCTKAHNPGIRMALHLWSPNAHVFDTDPTLVSTTLQ